MAPRRARLRVKDDAKHGLQTHCMCVQKADGAGDTRPPILTTKHCGKCRRRKGKYELVSMHCLATRKLKRDVCKARIIKMHLRKYEHAQAGSITYRARRMPTTNDHEGGLARVGSAIR